MPKCSATHIHALCDHHHQLQQCAADTHVGVHGGNLQQMQSGNGSTIALSLTSSTFQALVPAGPAQAFWHQQCSCMRQHDSSYDSFGKTPRKRQILARPP